MKLVPLTLSSFPVEKAGSASASWKCNAVQVASRACQPKYSLWEVIRACCGMKI